MRFDPYDNLDEEDPRAYYERDAPEAALIAIWADAPEIEAPALITTQVYRFAQEDAA